MSTDYNNLPYYECPFCEGTGFKETITQIEKERNPGRYREFLLSSLEVFFELENSFNFSDINQSHVKLNNGSEAVYCIICNMTGKLREDWYIYYL